MDSSGYYAQQQPPAAVPAPGSVVSSGGGVDKLPEFATFEVDKPMRGEPEGERIPLNPRSRTVSPPLPEDRMGGASAFNGPSLRRAPSDRSDGYGPPQRGAGPLSRPVPPGQVRGQYSNNTLPTTTSGSSGPYGAPPMPRGYGGPNNGYGGDRYGGEGGPQGGYRGQGPVNGPGMFNPGAGLAPPPRRGPGPGQFGPRGPPPPGMGPYGGGGQYGVGPRNGMGPEMGPRGMGPENGMGPRNMGPDHSMGLRGMGPDNGMGPQGGMGPRGGMGPENGIGPRNMGPDNGMGPGGPQGGMMMMGPGGRRSMPRNYDYPADEPIIDERREFEQTLPPVAVGVEIGVAATSDDQRDDGHAPVELAGDLHREPTPPRLSVVNETRPAVPYQDDEYIPPRAAWGGQTTGTPPPGRQVTPSPVELPATDTPASRATVVPRPSDSYYEDVAPAFDNSHLPQSHGAHPAALMPGPAPVPAQAFPLQIPPQEQRQMTLEELQDGQRSPAMSTTSNFTSISQRPPNPNWQPGYAPPMPGQMGMGGPAPRRGPTPSQLLGGNPDFELPGVGPRGGRGGRGLGMGR